MFDEELKQEIYNAVLEGDHRSIQSSVKRAVEEENIPPLVIINEILNPALKEVGDEFDKGTMYLPQLILSAEAMEAAVEILEPLLLARDEQMYCPGKVLMATVQGDIHDIGKNIVGALLRANGFEVIDLGRDVSANKIVQTAVEEDVDIIGLSALLSTTLPYCRDTIRLLDEKDLSDRFHVFIGGGAVTPDYAEDIGGLYGGEHAEAAVRNLLAVMEEN
jgi:5-methyltetrahydrofolate--homocysteine methyltransferase